MKAKGSIVKYKGQYCLIININNAGFLQMLDSKGKKMIGTPTPQKVEDTGKTCPVRYHLVRNKEGKVIERHDYVKTKLGVFSCSTGNKIVQPRIVSLFPTK